MSANGVTISMGGQAVIYCVHDRQKRVVTSEADIARVGLSVGVVYDPQQHKIHRCACCQNLFVDPGDQPRFCHQCGHRPLAHPLGGLLPEPIGVVDE
jgi:rRNA maturation endonuclease Nob1